MPSLPMVPISIFPKLSMWILKALSTPLGKLVVAVERRSHFTGLQTP
jgi:hypothetical protein